MSEDVISLLLGLALLATAFANSRWDFATITDAQKPPIFAEVDRDKDERRGEWRRNAQRVRTVIFAALGVLVVTSALLRLALGAIRG